MVERIGSYEILGELGRGASGVVYRARQASLNREVALKVLSETLAADPDYVARFHREAETAASLDHPLIVTIYDTGVADGYHYIAMRYVRGVTLDSALRSRLPEPAVALNIAGQIAEALAYAHGKGIVHRDLKPANVLVTHEGRIALADFGIARATESPGQTMAGQVLGTPEYMSPEQARGEKADARSDIYALGMILYQMLTGKPAFTGGDALSIIYRQVSEAPTPVRELRPEVPEAVAALVETCLAKDPDHRFQAAEAVYHALQAAGSAPSQPAPAPEIVAPEAAIAGANAPGPATLPDAESAATLTAVPEQELAVLSVDIVRSTHLKQVTATDMLSALFGAYRTTANQTIHQNGSVDHVWSGDGLLALFPGVEPAVTAAQQIQRAMPRLNRDHHAEGPTALKVRAAVHIGPVPWQPGVPVGEVISLTLDVAGRLQKVAQPGEVAASWAAFSQLSRRAGFLPGPKTGPLAGAFCWSEWQEQQDVAPATPSSEAPLDPAVTNQLKAALAMQSLSAPSEGAAPWMRILGIALGIAAVSVVLLFIGRSLTSTVRVDGGKAGRSPRLASRPDNVGKNGSSTVPATPTPAPAQGEGGAALALPAEKELSWTYRETSGQPPMSATVTETLSGVATLPGQTVAKLSSTDRTQPMLLARVRPDGLAVYGAAAADGRAVGALYSPPYRLLPNPLPVGAPLDQEFSVEARDPNGGSRMGTGRARLTVGAGRQRRTVPAGSFEAYPFELQEEMTLPPEPPVTTIRKGWVSPGAGIIEEQVTRQAGTLQRFVTRVLEAKSF